jgi:hypothetical protein
LIGGTLGIIDAAGRRHRPVPRPLWEQSQVRAGGAGVFDNSASPSGWRCPGPGQWLDRSSSPCHDDVALSCGGSSRFAIDVAADRHCVRQPSVAPGASLYAFNTNAGASTRTMPSNSVDPRTPAARSDRASKPAGSNIWTRSTAARLRFDEALFGEVHADDGARQRDRGSLTRVGR